MKNKRKHAEQSDKAEDMAKKKLAKLTKVTKADGPKVLEIKQKVSDAIESRKNANNIVDVIGLLSVTEPAVVVSAAINGVKRVLSTALERREVGEEGNEGEGGAEEKYRAWMGARLQVSARELKYSTIDSP